MCQERGIKSPCLPFSDEAVNMKSDLPARRSLSKARLARPLGCQLTGRVWGTYGTGNTNEMDVLLIIS